MKNKGIVLAAAMAATAATGALTGLVFAQAAHDEKAEKHEGYQDDGKVNGETLENVKVKLDGGLAASSKAGKPISAKFEKHEGKLQLSVYTAKAGKFSEVVVDTKSGKAGKAEMISSGEDLTAAKAQSEAMSKAKLTLGSAVRKALDANKGFAAISVYPSIKDGHPVAAVTIGREENLKTVSIMLD